MTGAPVQREHNGFSAPGRVGCKTVLLEHLHILQGLRSQAFTLNGLNEDMLVKILSEPRNAILKQYQKLLALDEVKLEFDEGALHAIAAKAMEKNTGARALRAILEEYMLDIMYEIPKDDSIGQVIITKEYIEGNGGPQILLRGQEVPLLPHND